MEYLNLLNINSASILKDIIFEVKRFISMFISPISTILNKLFTIIIMILESPILSQKFLLLCLVYYLFIIYQSIKF